LPRQLVIFFPGGALPPKATEEGATTAGVEGDFIYLWQGARGGGHRLTDANGRSGLHCPGNFSRFPDMPPKPNPWEHRTPYRIRQDDVAKEQKRMLDNQRDQLRRDTASREAWERSQRNIAALNAPKEKPYNPNDYPNPGYPTGDSTSRGTPGRSGLADSFRSLLRFFLGFFVLVWVVLVAGALCNNGVSGSIVVPGMIVAFFVINWIIGRAFKRR
jgi:hypothetical protein